MIDPTASDCKKVTRYVNTASDIKPPSDKLPSNNPPVKTEPVQKPSLQASTKITVKVSPPVDHDFIKKEEPVQKKPNEVV
jgi:hypothetical protein